MAKLAGDTFFDRYIAFLKRFKWPIIIMWLVALGVGLIFFQKFMQHTTSQFEPPSSSLAYKAGVAYDKQFPGQSKMSTVLIVVERKDGQSPIDLNTNQNLLDFIAHLEQKINKNLDPVPTMSYYWKFANQSLFTLADTFVSNNVTLIDLAVDNTNNKVANKNLDKILDYVHELRANSSLSDYKIQVTGELVFYKDVREGADKDLARVDGITLPIALLVLAFVLRSLRLVLMPLLSIGVSVLTSFTIMYPISFAIDVVSVTPSLMMSTTIALSIDYSLFLFSRFMEEIRAGHDAVRAMETSLRMAGETIFVSGTTLCICFLGLTLLPLTLLQTMGLGAGCAVLCAMCNSLNLVPALVFAFPKFFGNADTNDLKNLFLKITSCCRGRQGNEAFRLAPMPSSVPRDVRYELNHSRWFRWTRFTIKYRIPVFLVLLASMAPFLWQALLMQTSSQVTLTVPRNVESVTAYNVIGDRFGDGALMPYFLLLVARSGSHALEPSFFNSSLTLLQRMENVTNTERSQFTGVLIFNGTYVDHEKWAQAMANPKTEFDKTLRALTGPLGFVNNNDTTAATAQKVEIVLRIDPSSPDGKSWLMSQRDVLKERDWGVDVYLSNGASTEIDGIDLVYQFLPVQFAVTAGVVFLLMLAAFRSLVVPVRSIFSIALTLSWTYGIAKLVYNDGILGWLSWSAVAKYDGISWFTPVMCFSILTGFGLDYDIFLLTRIAEYRSLGFTNTASISLAVHKTGGIITAAGCIMAIAFGGLLFSTMPLLNMCSFFIVLSVLFDTFVVRTIMVPALMAIIGRFNFWPRNLPIGVKDVWDMPAESAEAPSAGLE